MSNTVQAALFVLVCTMALGCHASLRKSRLLTTPERTKRDLTVCILYYNIPTS